MKAILQNNTIILYFQYDKSVIEKVKTLYNAVYDSSKRYWTAGLCTYNIKLLKQYNFELSKDIHLWLRKHTNSLENYFIESDLPLFPFQKENLAFINRNNGNCLVADDMGLGKSLTSIAYLKANPDLSPALIVCPATLKGNWELELKKWNIGKEVEIFTGGKPYKSKASIHIINYDLLHKWQKELPNNNYKIIICDESHKIRDPSTLRTKAFKKIITNIPKRLCLSGTPITNRPIEFFTSLNAISPNVFSNYVNFGFKFCKKKDPFAPCGYNFNGAYNLDILFELTKDVMIRHLKKDVLKELPDKLKSIVPIDMEDYKEYQKAELEIFKGISGKPKASQLAEISRLKQIAVKQKLPFAIQWINDFLEENDKLVIFAHHKEVINKLMEVYGNIAVKVDGSVIANERMECVKRFQEDKNIKLFVGNIQAAGVGLTLTISDSCLFLELPWTPADLIQCEDRCHRIGQQNCVNIYYLVAKNSIEEKIIYLLDNKANIISQVLDGKEIEEECMLTALINKMM